MPNLNSTLEMWSQWGQKRDLKTGSNDQYLNPYRLTVRNEKEKETRGDALEGALGELELVEEGRPEAGCVKLGVLECLIGVHVLGPIKLSFLHL